MNANKRKLVVGWVSFLNPAYPNQTNGKDWIWRLLEMR